MKNLENISFSASNQNLTNLSVTSPIIVMEKIIRLFNTRKNTHATDKNYSGGLYAYVQQVITQNLMQDIRTNCYSKIDKYLPEYSGDVEFNVIGDTDTNQFAVEIIYLNKYRAVFESKSLYTISV